MMSLMEEAIMVWIDSMKCSTSAGMRGRRQPRRWSNITLPIPARKYQTACQQQAYIHEQRLVNARAEVR